MQHLDTPAAAGEQPILGPSSPGDSPATARNTPDAPLERDSVLLTAPPADDTCRPMVSTPAGVPPTDSSPGDAAALAKLIAEGRKPRSRRFTELEPYRAVLLAERRAGASIRLIAQSLAKVGVTISEETLRVWLLRQKMPKRRRPRKKAVVATPTSIKPAVLPRPGTPLVPSPTPPAYTPRRGPRIARDDF